MRTDHIPPAETQALESLLKISRGDSGQSTELVKEH